jgi:hypothetical protein
MFLTLVVSCFDASGGAAPSQMLEAIYYHDPSPMLEAMNYYDPSLGRLGTSRLP